MEMKQAIANPGPGVATKHQTYSTYCGLGRSASGCALPGSAVVSETGDPCAAFGAEICCLSSTAKSR